MVSVNSQSEWSAAKPWKKKQWRLYSVQGSPTGKEVKSKYGYLRAAGGTLQKPWPL